MQEESAKRDAVHGTSKEELATFGNSGHRTNHFIFHASDASFSCMYPGMYEIQEA
jgi:hypothetical protein